jgi:hypothetical protein
MKMDDNPFESELMAEGDAQADSADSGDAAFGEGGAGDEFDALADGLAGGDALDAGDVLQDELDAAGDGFDALDEGVDAMALWDAFEEEVADGLDAADEDEFLGRVLGGLGRIGGLLRRGLGGASGVAGRVAGMAGRAGRIAGQVGQVAGHVSPAAMAAARVAQMLGAPGVAGGLRSVAGGARQMQGWAGQAGRMAGAAGRAAGGAQGLLGQLSQLIGGGGDEFDDFDAMADLLEDGVDEALPAAVALAARAAARGLGFRNVGQLTMAGRRALVRGVASAARELVRQRGPRAVRALPRLAQSAARVATQRVATPQQAVQAVRRHLPRTARRLATQQPQALQRLARPGAGRAQGPLVRDTQVGRGQPSTRIAGPRTFYIDGPVKLTVTPR